MFEAIVGLAARVLGPGLILGLAVGGAAVFGWDRRGADWPAYPVKLPFGLHFTLGFGDGFPVRLTKDEAALARAAAGQQRLNGALNAENAAVSHLATAAARWRSASIAAEQAAARSNRWRSDLSTQLLRQPAPADASELGLCRAADAVLKEGAQ